jgi:8-oxo-dGTP pyrophosphatase MutT (NUDIX family)
MEHALVVAAAAILDEGRLLLVSKRVAPDVYYLPGGKVEEGEDPTAALVRELAEELGVVPTSLRPFAEVAELAALERVPMQMTVFLAEIEGTPLALSEIAELVWLDPAGTLQGTLAPAVEKHVVPQLRERGLLAAS